MEANDLEKAWFADKQAKHPKGPMTEEEKEKLFEENPKFKEMNEEYGDVVKDKHNKEAAEVTFSKPHESVRGFVGEEEDDSSEEHKKKASKEYIAILLESTQLRGYALICPVDWLAYPEDAFHILQMNVKVSSVSRSFTDPNGRKYSVFFVDKGSNKKSLFDLDSLFGDVNAIYELVDEGYLNSKCIQAFH